MGVLDDKHIALLAADGFEDSELTKPMQAVEDEGAQVTVVSIKDDEIIGKNGTQITVDQLVSQVSVDDFDGLLLPGGVKNPDVMRMNDDAVGFVADFFAQGKPVAAICHAPWMLIEADVVKDKELTSWPSLRTDIENAGGSWVDEEVVVDQGLVTSRKPADLDAFCEKAIEEFAEGEHDE